MTNWTKEDKFNSSRANLELSVLDMTNWTKVVTFNSSRVNLKFSVLLKRLFHESVFHFI